MNITINHENYELPLHSTISQFLACTIQDPCTMVIAVNHQIIPRSQYEDYILQENDVMDLITPMGGG